MKREMKNELRGESGTGSRKVKAPVWVIGVLALVCICSVVLGIRSLVQRGALDGRKPIDIQKNSGEGYTYSSYAGPVFPMTSLGESKGIVVERDINFDFMPYESYMRSYQVDEDVMDGYETYERAANICDNYSLKNDTDNEKTLKLIYPFVASLSSRRELLPEILANGELTDTSIHIGPYTGSFSPVDGVNGAEGGDEDWNLSELHTWAEYIRLIENGYQKEAFIPQSFQPDYGQSSYVIVIGDDIKEWKLEAYTDGGCEKKMENAGGTVTRYESTLDSMLKTMVDRFESMEEAFLGEFCMKLIEKVPKEELVGLVSEALLQYGVLSNHVKERYIDGRLEDMLSETKMYQRVMYLEFEVKIPANATVRIETSMRKEASYDYFGEYESRVGYDMMTKLGSTLEFLKQTASIQNSDKIEIINQNFDFNLKKGITKVELEQQKEHYFMDVRKKN